MWTLYNRNLNIINMLGEIFEEFCIERNLSKSSSNSYKHSLNDYCKYNNLSLEKLIDEADKEEEEKVRGRNRNIVKRLKGYRAYKVKNDASINTIKNNYSKIRTFYRHNGIEIPYIPPINLNEEYHERYSDIPTIEHIKEAVEGTNNLKHKAIILFMSSSGTARKETMKLKIKDFLKATKKYYKSKKIEDILDELYQQEDIVPIFEMIRFKTNYPYYTCCSHEATKAIVKYLKYKRKDLKPEDSLFKLSNRGFVEVFTRINDKHKWGKTGHRRFFHSHALRKFNATAIEDIGLANTIQGRKPDKITEAYFKKDPERIRDKYMNHLQKLTINETIVNVLDKDTIKEYDKKFNEMLKRAENAENIVKEYKDIIEKEKENKKRNEYFDQMTKNKKFWPAYRYILGRKEIDLGNIDLLKNIIKLNDKIDFGKMKQKELEKEIDRIIEKSQPYKIK